MKTRTNEKTKTFSLTKRNMKKHFSRDGNKSSYVCTHLRDTQQPQQRKVFPSSFQFFFLEYKTIKREMKLWRHNV